MKKIIVFMIVTLSCLLLVGCNKKLNYKLEPYSVKNTAYLQKLNAVNYPDTDLKFSSIDNTDFKTALSKFSAETCKELFVEKKNYIYSPTSLYIALSMLLEGTDDNTYTELANLLNVNNLPSLRSDLKKVYESSYYTNADGVLRIANSFWAAKNFNIKKNYSDTLSDNYFAEGYSVDFASDEGKQKIIDWINHYTFNLLDLNKNNYKIDDDLVLLLINTIYFNNSWSTEFKEKNTYTDAFYLDENTIDVSYMKHTVLSNYYEEKNHYMVTDRFKNGNSVKYILPKDESTVNDIIDNQELFASIISGQDCKKFYDEDNYYVNATISVPKFKYSSNYNLNDNLIALGVDDIFDISSANFSKITDEKIFVSYIKQNATIEFNESGAKAAAVTSIGISKSAAMVGNDLIITLDRPFIYIIYNQQSIPLFVGIVNNPTK